jgi:hypothetical protein
LVLVLDRRAELLDLAEQQVDFFFEGFDAVEIFDVGDFLDC